MKVNIARALVVTAEVMGHELSTAAAEVMARELAQHDESAVATALRRCQRELTGKLSLARILERLPGQHISADEAWALCPRSEDDTVVWTDQIAVSYAAASPLLDEGDQVAARMAFKGAYERALADANGEPPKWWASLGHKTDGRASPVTDAVRLGRLTAERAEQLVGHYLSAGESERLRQLQPGAKKIGDMLKLPSEAK